MSFEDRVNRRLELWLARHPGVLADDIKRKRKSIARRLNEEEAERQDRQK
jgi:dsDNA-binding SOS-regulon protein